MQKQLSDSNTRVQLPPPPAPTTSEDPYSIFDGRQKALIVAIVSTAATFSGFASNIYFPAIPTIAQDLSVSTELINLTVTSYLIFQGIAPSFWGPISDVKGRRIAYACTFVVFLGACIGLAETENFATLLVLRCLQSTGSASTIAIGSGVIGDITTRAERGSYMGWFQAGLLVPVAAGPVIGGALSGSLGWRAIFWFLTTYTAVFLVVLLLFLPETLRSLVGNGGLLPVIPFVRYPLNLYQSSTKVQWHNSNHTTRPPKKHVDVLGPLHILVSKQAAPIIIFLATYYAVWQMSITAMSTLFKDTYHLTETQIGLTFLANGIGSMIGTLSTGKVLDIDYRRVRAKHLETGQEGTTGDSVSLSKNETDVLFPLEKARMRLIPLFAALQCISIVIFGWTIQYSVHIAVPIVSTFITGWTAVSTQSIIMTYLVDVFQDRPAAASASLNLARCLLAAGGTSIVLPIIHSLGIGWTFTICMFVQITALLGFAMQWKFGSRWRQEAAVDT